MEPPIDGTQFGSITLGGIVYDHDVLVCPDATVRRREKKLSKAVYGTSHTISVEEAKYVYHHGEGAQRLIIGVRPKTSRHNFFIAVNWSGSRVTPCHVMPSTCIVLSVLLRSRP